MAKNDFQYGGWNSYILQCGTITTLISSGDCILQCGMRYVALELWQWIHQVAAPCNVIRGSGMTCHWIRPNVRHIGILHLVSISTHPRMSFCSLPVWRYIDFQISAKFYPNRTTVGRKKWRHVDFQDGVSQPSWVVGIHYWVLWKAQLSLQNFLEVVNEHHSSKLSSFWENRVFCILATDRQTDRQTDKEMNSSDAWSRSLAIASCGLRSL